MAVDFKGDFKRTSTYDFDPADIKINPELNGRHVLPDIQWLMKDILERGQLQPVAIRSDGGTPILCAGFSRWRAVSEINKGREPKDRLKLRCVYYKGNEADGFLANIAENRKRNDCTPIDDAYNIARLERYGRTVEQIAEFYGESAAWVSGRLALVELCQEGQDRVTAGTLKPTAAIAIAKLAEAQQREKLKGKKITVAEAKATADKPKKPGIKDLAAVLKAVIEDGKYPDGFAPVNSKDPVGDSLSLFCEALLKLMGVAEKTK